MKFLALLSIMIFHASLASAIVDVKVLPDRPVVMDIGTNQSCSNSLIKAEPPWVQTKIEIDNQESMDLVIRAIKYTVTDMNGVTTDFTWLPEDHCTSPLNVYANYKDTYSVNFQLKGPGHNFNVSFEMIGWFTDEYGLPVQRMSTFGQFVTQ